LGITVRVKAIKATIGDILPGAASSGRLDSR
jgi:hypothetical protein